MKTIIRHAKEADAKQIAHIHIASWQTIYRGLISDLILDNLSLEKRAIEWQELIKRGIDVWIIEHNKKMIGFANTCSSRDKDADPTKVAEISAIYLLPEFWRRTFGQQLCQMVCDNMKKKGFTAITLWVLEKNIQACRFYEKIGFQATGDVQTENFEGEYLREVRYKKILSQT